MVEWYRNLPFDKWVKFLNRSKNKKQLRRLSVMSLVDYSDMEKDILEAPEPEVLKVGEEVKCKIISVRTGTSDKNDCDWFMPVFEVVDQPAAAEFSDFFWELDEEKLTEKEFMRAKAKFGKLVKAFQIDLSRPIDKEDDLPGHEGWLIVGIKTSDEYGDQNTVRKYIAPRN